MAQPAHAPDAATRRQDRGDFPSENHRQRHLDLAGGAADGQSVGPHYAISQHMPVRYYVSICYRYLFLEVSSLGQSDQSWRVP